MALTWNPLDKAANITLSAGNLVATTTSGSQGLVRATAAAVATKVYIEGIATVDTGNWSFGWSNALQSLTAQLGSTANGFAANGNGNVFFNNNVIGTIGTTFSQPNLMRIAVDFTAKLVWIAIGGAFWNNSATADPATGAGGYSLAGIAAGPYFATFGAAGTGAQILGGFGATATWFAAPSGFSTPDTNVQAYIATPKFLGYSLISPPTTALSAFKFLGYSIIGPPTNAVSVFKMLGYAILAPSALNLRTNVEQPVPRQRRPLRPNGLSVPTNIALGVPAPTVINPPVGYSVDLPMRRARRMGFSPEGRIPPASTTTDEFIITLTWASWPQF